VAGAGLGNSDLGTSLSSHYVGLCCRSDASTRLPGREGPQDRGSGLGLCSSTTWGVAPAVGAFPPPLGHVPFLPSEGGLGAIDPLPCRGARTQACTSLESVLWGLQTGSGRRATTVGGLLGVRTLPDEARGHPQAAAPRRLYVGASPYSKRAERAAV